MKLFYAPQTRSSRAIWMLEEAGVDYELELVDIRAEDRTDSEEFLRASPMGKVPALIDGDAAMAESAAICLYVADVYAPGRLAPAVDDASRGKFLYWLMYTPAVVEPAISEVFNKVEPNRLSSGWGDFPTMIETWESGLSDKDWIVGDEFSADEVMLGSSAVYMRLFDKLPDSPTLNAYADRCLARPGYQKALELSS